MARILGLDFGTKRTGIAVTDSLQIAVNPLETLPTIEVPEFLSRYTAKEPVDKIVCGHPGTENADTLRALTEFVAQVNVACPGIPVVFQDETLTSRRAAQVIYQSGVPKMRRRSKALVDKISAVLILQDYLGHLYDVHST